MFQESFKDKILAIIRKFIPTSLFRTFKPAYHWSLAMLGAIWYGFPSQSMKVIAVTGTKGKSSIVYMITKILEDAGKSVAMVGSLGFKIKDKTWPNTLKMTMPGRTKLQHFLYRAKNAGVEYVVLEVTSEGIEQFRLVGIDVNCAVFCNLRPEHIESHGSFEHYKRAKQKLFKKTTYIHVVNNEDPAFFDFAQFPAQRTITYGMTSGMINAKENPIHLKILGDFNVSNAMAAIAIADAYDLNRKKAIQSLEQISHIPGRMEIIHAPEGFSVVVDYAHTPDSLEAVYRNLEPLAHEKGGKLIGVLGAAGGGRDIWKREQFGSLAEQYCDQIILTNEDPYDENPAKIIDDVAKGFTSNGGTKYTIIMDRKEAIHSALAHAQTNDVIVVTGKGSEISMALAHGVKIPWSDKKIVEEWL